MNSITAKEAGLGLCPKCHKLNKMYTDHQKCQRCHAMFCQRKPKSLGYTIAWTFAAIIFLIPANLFPMVVFYTIGDTSATTILEGIDYLIVENMMPIAIVVFIASFIIPIAKIAGLIVLIHAVWFKSKLSAKQRSRIFYWVEFLGPWSMLDIFVIALMVGVVNLSYVTTIEAGPGSSYFALMVIFTMFAAHSFDPRLLWDTLENDTNKE